ncbi:NUDIX hydrolase [Flexibacterium corallicola]|uniref:NUDIX hydrolase n=1 Tax=Flexibacterium corallicola TaxID=3037259 RepID=UPI00286F8053|nr:NUDIX hydrolase [Pseudovibrio sp. M1P-2-3]
MTEALLKIDRPAVETEEQFAALPFRRSKSGDIQVLLITSRETKRWVLPKGWPMPNKSGPETAGIEAYEEAGLYGKIKKKSVGSYLYFKVFKTGRSLPCSVKVYPMKVDRLSERWPEQHQRTRKWFGIKKAIQSVDEPSLKALLRSWAVLA